MKKKNGIDGSRLFQIKLAVKIIGLTITMRWANVKAGRFQSIVRFKSHDIDIALLFSMNKRSILKLG